MVLTIPIQLIYHADYLLLEGTFDEAEVIPMIKVRDETGNDFEDEKNVLKDILEHRIDLALFEENCYDMAIKYSGGSLRELFRIINEASLNEDEDIIRKATMEKAILHFKDIFSSRIQERDDDVKITFDEYLDSLFEIDGGNKRQPAKNHALLDLLRTRSVMKYNGEGFYDTHPLLDTFIELYRDKRENQKK